MNVNAQDEKLLLLQIAEGNENAFTVLVERKWNNIYLQALTYVKVSAQARILFRMFFKGLAGTAKNCPQLKISTPGCSSLPVYAHYQHAPKKKSHLPLDADDLEIEEKNYLPDRTLAQKTLAALIARAIELLPQQQKKAYLLSRDQDLSHEEIAASMQVSKKP